MFFDVFTDDLEGAFGHGGSSKMNNLKSTSVRRLTIFHGANAAKLLCRTAAVILHRAVIPTKEESTPGTKPDGLFSPGQIPPASE